MSNIRCDLVVRLDESSGSFSFFLSKKRVGEINGLPEDESEFSVEIDLEELKSRGEVGAERLIGKSVLGFFDHLTNGRLDLPKHYLDDSDSEE